jgi:hypothetical protein
LDAQLFKGAIMPKLPGISTKLFAAAVLALSFLISPSLSATENGRSLSPVASQPMDLATFLGTMSGTPAPPPEDVIYCSYSGCPTGQTCRYCNRNWVCIWNYPDPEQVPPGCSGGPV